MPKQYPRELRERAVRMVAGHRSEYETEYAAIRSVAAKLRIATPESPRVLAGRVPREIRVPKLKLAQSETAETAELPASRESDLIEQADAA